MTKLARLDDMITAIALLVYPDENKRDAKKIVRNAFEHSERTGEIAVSCRDVKGRPLVIQRGFECWAAGKWPLLRAIFQVPIVATMECSLPKITMSAIGVVMPKAHEMDEKFLEVSVELVKTRERLATHEVELSELRKRDAERQAADEETSRKKSEAGKLGGRGNYGGVKPK